ncbi:bifunctional lysylphosphatidylglycerol flippase/synthetase MprF [Rhodococcus koreensis]|uniref:bifunctional lysylphosphatidylglycerol flippase/synthetase MprF n=1 Tax=Rhodococcus koreensis TaxID=99653 RepID=UPI000932CE88|nr:phosphatidylglycerol lysyltransferase domain-containing protein [Rhodococcus koreensis]
MRVQNSKSTPTTVPGLRVYRPESPAARMALVGATVVVGLVLMWMAGRSGPVRTWMVASGIAVLLVARGLHLRRPVTVTHAAAAVLMVAVADVAYSSAHSTPGFLLLVATGPVLMLPVRSVPQPEDRARVFSLIQRTTDDPLSPFALNSAKSYYLNASGTAAIAYRARSGIAVVSGDPIGDPLEFGALLDAFDEFAAERGWRVAVLGAGERVTRLWEIGGDTRKPLTAVPIGRDVVIDVGSFTLHGRKFRNLRQAVQRTRNAGLTTEIVPEAALDEPTRRELTDIVDAARAGHQRRGFSMILDHLLDGTLPGVLLVVARDCTGRAVAFQRYGTADSARELSLDVPWRGDGAPNGTDERMTVDVIRYAERTGARYVSLSFAAFPELLDPDAPGAGARLFRRVLHLGDALIALESLYRYLGKFHATGNRRYVLLRFRYLLPVAFACLTFEFVPHRERD